MSENLSFFSSDKIPPQNIEAEEAILGGILLNPERLLGSKTFLLQKHFTSAPIGIFISLP